MSSETLKDQKLSIIGVFVEVFVEVSGETLKKNAFEFIKENGGVTTETLYPYQAKDAECDALKVFHLYHHNDY